MNIAMSLCVTLVHAKSLNVAILQLCNHAIVLGLLLRLLIYVAPKMQMIIKTATVAIGWLHVAETYGAVREVTHTTVMV